MKGHSARRFFPSFSLYSSDTAQIISRNVFTWFNAMVTPAAIALFVLEKYQGAVAVSGMAIANTVLGLAQELHAKRQLDRLAIVVQTRVNVRRGAAVQQIAADAVISGDEIMLHGGEPVVADGTILEARYLEVDEALLTGEADPVRRQPGERLLSGSVCVAGEGVYRAEQVGREAFAKRLETQARHYHASASPLTRVINRLVQILSYTAIALIGLFTVTYLVRGGDRGEYVSMVAATITSMVPQGMVLTATLAFMVGAIALGRRGAIVQHLHAVETMASIDVICTDKTGTLTTNQLRLERIDVLSSDVSESTVRQLLLAFVSATVDQSNRNVQAIQAAVGKGTAEFLEQIPFKSQNRYSAVRVCDGAEERVLVLGAVEALGPFISTWQGAGQDVRASVRIDELAKSLESLGQRLLLFAEASPNASLAGLTNLPNVPLRPLALLSLGDELRHESPRVLESLATQGIAFKVLSGDNPRTVLGTVRQIHASLACERIVSGSELTDAPDAAALIEKCSVFGRVSPDQKVGIVQTLQQAGHRVAMIGDGVNDVLPIKQADLGIAMGAGSQASKAVSGLVLTNNDFALLPEMLEEGRVIVRNLRRSSKLFLVKNVYSFIFIVAYAGGLFGMPFPYLPQQVTLLNWLVIGLPALAIALSRERSTTPARGHFLREVGGFALRTGVVFALCGLVTLGVAAWRHPDDQALQRTLLLSVLVFLGITALWRALRDGEPTNARVGNRFALLASLAVPVYLLAMYVPSFAAFFELVPLGASQWFAVLIVAGVGYLATLAADWIFMPRL